jgi:hypothetical protein
LLSISQGLTYVMTEIDLVDLRDRGFATGLNEFAGLQVRSVVISDDLLALTSSYARLPRASG